MKHKYHALFLSSKGVLKQYFAGHIPDIDEIKRLVFIEARAENPHLPDYFYRNNQRISVGEVNNLSQLLLHTIHGLSSEYLTFDGLNIHVTSQKFSKWQEVLTRVAPLMLITGAIDDRIVSPKDRVKAIQMNLDKTALPFPKNKLLDAMIDDQGLNELHIHLNGSTEMDYHWLKTLENPNIFRHTIKKALRESIVKEQYLQLDDGISDRDLFVMLKVARILRDLMVRIITDENSNKIDIFKELKQSTFPYRDYHCLCLNKEHPAQALGVYAKASLLEQEAFFLLKALEALSGKGELFSHYFYFYLLIKQYFNRFIVQQENQWGFDQFQKITSSDHLDHIEKKDYSSRFRQLEGMHGESIAKLEGRFASKEVSHDNKKLLVRIIEGFEKYATNGRQSRYTPEILKNHEFKKRMVLTLVAHMIKKDEKVSNRKELSVCRFQKMRHSCLHQAKSIDYVCRVSPKIKKYFTGIDAAGNEMYTPPEVFSPSFRYMRRRGFNNVTYHAGEDYVHLVSGMRAVYEAVTFLDMSSGNRVGHATALGIAPKLWQERIGDKIVIKRGEWFDDLIWAIKILTPLPKMAGILFDLENEASNHYTKIYGNMIPYNLHTCIAAWELRRLDPLVAFDRKRHI